MDLLNAIRDTIFQKNIARIHFRNKEDEKKGLGILAFGENSFRIYLNDDYGLTSENQLKLLDKANIIYKRVY